MGPKYTIQILIMSLLLGSCGNFVGFDTPDSPDTGELKALRLYIGSSELVTLQNSLSTRSFAGLRLTDDRKENPFEAQSGKIRIRGNSSRFREKKSYTLELQDGDDRVRYALDAGGDVWFQYGLTLYISAAMGIHTPQFSPVALYINNDYRGYYNVVPLYNDDLNDESAYNDKEGQLFKPYFEYDQGSWDTHALSEKKFPDDGDFSTYDRLIVNYENMSSQEWVRWIETPGVMDFEGMSDYMVMRDFFGIHDTSLTNHYIYFYDKGCTILPWDDDSGFLYSDIGGNNTLTRRMLESESYKTLYTKKMKECFLDSEDTLDLARDYIDDLYALLSQAASVEPYFTRESFEEEYNYLHTFFNNRPQDIIDNNPDWDF